MYIILFGFVIWMLEYKSDKRNSIDYGSKRIVVFFDIMQRYFNFHESLYEDVLRSANNMMCDDIDPATFNRYLRNFIFSIRQINRLKNSAESKLNRFYPKAYELLEKYHPDEFEKYRKELNDAYAVVMGEIQNWEIPRKDNEHDCPFVMLEPETSDSWMHDYV